MKKILTAALLAGGLVMATATAASAHSSAVTHVESCPDGADSTKTVVTFNNDYELTATVTYQWGSGSSSTVPLAARASENSTKPVVSLPIHDVGTLKYHVKWSDNFRQPEEGDSTLKINELPNCPEETTTSSTSSTSTTSTSTTTTTAPAIITPPAPVVQPLVVEQAAVVPTEVLGVTLTAPAPAPVGGVQTGGGGTSQSGNLLLPLGLGLGCIALIGLAAMQLRRSAVS